MNDGKAIITRQEQESNIRLLAAQRRLYSKAKIFKYLQIALSVVPPVAVTFLQIAGVITADIAVFLVTEALMMCGAAIFGRQEPWEPWHFRSIPRTV
ncbi:S-4TM family putative pore-forming effector [Adlercreutzia sp. ZJ138]|uniref:S-4TM family putative pore-forming effector n=1 Tax=Adlercreutzia sp. ZJ138 TaxID=2709405 RepID=UPI0013EC8481|nr:S-4TM family putative pore-forming effector [Adlercreutzia sp. ZJ138]